MMFRALQTVLCVLAFGCANPANAPSPVPGSAYRVGMPEMKNRPAKVHILQNERACSLLYKQLNGSTSSDDPSFVAFLDSCAPKVDRASGTVELSFYVSSQQDDTPLNLPMTSKHIRILHNGSRPEDAELNLLPQGKHRADQLFIVLIDHSYSMDQPDPEGVSRMERVRQALTANAGNFFTGGSKAVLMRFYQKGRAEEAMLEGLDGTAWKDVKPLVSEAAFQVKLSELGQEKGWTPIFSTVNKAVGPVLSRDTALGEAMLIDNLTPTIVLITDGFNNTYGEQKCKDNVPLLNGTLRKIQDARRSLKADSPEVYTIGFGEPLNPQVDLTDAYPVAAETLCGSPSRANTVINGRLENEGIDNVSLEMLAQLGGGKAFVSPDYRKLSEVLKETSPVRYSWFKVRYSMGPQYHRASFTSSVRLSGIVEGESSVEFHPSAWLGGAPPVASAEPGEGLKAGDSRMIAVVATLALSLLALFVYLGPALFNLQRALFRRSRRTSK